MSDPFSRVVNLLIQAKVRVVVIGVWGINYYARSSGTLFTTLDRDLFLPLDPSNLLTAWKICDEGGLTLWSGEEPLGLPRDLTLAQAVIQHRALTSALDEAEGLRIDLSLLMGEFTFDEVWRRRRTFVVDEVHIPVASLTDMVAAKAAAGRKKDRLFLATYAEALRDLQREVEKGADEF